MPMLRIDTFRVILQDKCNFNFVMNLTVLAYKLPDGLWAFDHPHNDTKEEWLMNGTEEAIDEYFYRKTGSHAVTNSECEIYLSTEAFDGSDTTIIKEVEDDEGTTYMDEVINYPVWLCKWLNSFFGEAPEQLYIRLSPV